MDTLQLVDCSLCHNLSRFTLILLNIVLTVEGVVKVFFTILVGDAYMATTIVT